MASHSPARVTLAELVATLSLVADLGMGRPMERVLRQTVIAMRLGTAAGMEQATRASAYYTSLLTWVGCATETSEVAALFGDETEVYADTRDEDLGGVTLAVFVARHLGRGRSGFRRIGMVGKFVATAGRSVQQVMVGDLTRARHLPSPQLTGTTRAPMTDLNMLAAQGVRIVARLGRVIDGVAQFSGSLANVCALADLKMNRFLNRADEWATASGLDNELPPAHRFARTRVNPRSPLELNLSTGEITTVLWATGFRPDYSWLDIAAVRDRTGHVRHDGRLVTNAPGLYLLGMPVPRTRASTYIHGAAADTEALAAHLHCFLSNRCRSDRSGTSSGP